ncbi:OLC1v1029380C1 [Oldenlandia corymbosa var. corymbosa]|uniref:OLC1v1029380C1 n=1 Tax=Oldenlandia corymbosa var. corymbosa TaxID=529605 RepID=A0AAV1CEM1_OLDCO|nr:OLC1v1029380C1 [Oldenlandia corymbosa var. corymbosa]
MASTSRKTSLLSAAMTNPLLGARGSCRHGKGTSALGCIFNNEWIMVALDHSSLSPGSFPENVLELNSNLLAAFSVGSQNSHDFLLNHLREKCHKHELGEERKASAAEASKWLASFLSLHPDRDEAQDIFVSKFFFKPSSCISMVKAVDVAKSALCIGAYNMPESLECGSVFIVESARITPVVFSEDILAWEKHFNKAGREWQEPHLRKVHKQMAFF